MHRRLFSRPQLRSFLRLIEAKRDMVLEDHLFAAQRWMHERNRKPYDPEDILRLLSLMFFSRIAIACGGWDAVSWRQVKFDDDLCINIQREAPFRTEYLDAVTEGVVSGICRLTGTVHYGCLRLAIFTKFVAHPFYQYGQWSDQGGKPDHRVRKSR